MCFLRRGGRRLLKRILVHAFAIPNFTTWLFSSWFLQGLGCMLELILTMKMYKWQKADEETCYSEKQASLKMDTPTVFQIDLLQRLKLKVVVTLSNPQNCENRQMILNVLRMIFLAPMLGGFAWKKHDEIDPLYLGWAMRILSELNYVVLDVSFFFESVFLLDFFEMVRG